MKPRTTMDYSGIEAQVRRAKVQRAAYMGDLIGSGLFALSRIAARPFAALARAWRPKERIAPR